MHSNGSEKDGYQLNADVTDKVAFLWLAGVGQGSSSEAGQGQQELEGGEGLNLTFMVILEGCALAEY